MMRIGVAGVGRMGAAMAARLIELGHSVTVWNRSPGKVKPLVAAGAVAAETPAALLAVSEVVLTILTDAAAIADVYDGASGLLRGDAKGKLFIEMSTVLPETQVALAARVAAAGGAFVDCPVGGTVGPARQGKLFGVVGGSEADVARARPVLDQLCRRVEHVGPVGAGATMKLAINLPLMVYWQALGESLAMCRSLGLDPARTIDILSDTSGANTAVKNRGPMIAAMLGGGDPGTVTFDIDLARKDLSTMLTQAERVGVELPLVAQTRACFEQAQRAGWGARDGSGQAVFWATRDTK